jgi:hypothetical protein
VTEDRPEAGQDRGAEAVGPGRHEWMRSDRVAGVLLFLLGVFAGAQALALPLGSLGTPGPGYAPLLLSTLLAGLGLAIVLTGGASAKLPELDWSDLPHALLILGGGIFATLTLEPLGYRLSTLALLLFYLGVVERRSVPATLAVSAGMAFGSYYVFATLLKVPLPTGPFGL